jgi:putative phage-type endonuclease
MRIELNEHDMLEIEIDVYENIEEYLINEIINISSPQFYDELIEDITNVFHDYWADCGICDEDDYDEVTNIVENLLDVYLDFSKIPRRSLPYQCILENANKNIIEISNQIDALKQMPQPKQKTKEWYEFRYNLITASNIWKALSSESQRNSLIYEKCKPFNSFQSNNSMTNIESAFHWGIKYEPLTVMVYEHMYQTKIDDFGCINHPDYDFIGASPDGINIDPSNKERFGRMLEIKNIVNRDITGIPKEEYWVQTQVQMETCDLEECDFVETRFKEYPSEQEFYSDTEREYKGLILYFVVNTTNMSTQEISENLSNVNAPVYRYMPVDVSCDKETIEEWVQAEKMNNPELTLFKINYWYLDEFSCVLIQRNKYWFEAALPLMRDTWQVILKERTDGYEHRASKKRVIKNDVFIQVEKSDKCTSQTIKNLPLTNSICLVKLDHDELLEEQ